MRYWSLIFLAITAPVFADGMLYTYLKTNPDIKTDPLNGFNFYVEPSPFLTSKLFPYSLTEYRISESLNEPFHPIKGDAGDDYLPAYINVNEDLPYRYKKVIEDSLYLQLPLIASIGVLATMPESFTSWNKDEFRTLSLSERWQKNVSTPPVWDNDPWTINYIGHPIAGAYYYTMARNDGMSISESAVFSAFVSTFFWEYGYEAFAEVPSIQDLIATPLLGSILGERMFILERKLDQNGGVIFGSKSLGDISYFLLDPLGNIADGIRRILKHCNIKPDVTMTIQTYPYAHSVSYPYAYPLADSIHRAQREYGFIITIR